MALQTAGAQRCGETVDALAQLGVGPAAVPVDDRDAVGMDRRAAVQERDRVELSATDSAAPRPRRGPVSLGGAAVVVHLHANLPPDGTPAKGYRWHMSTLTDSAAVRVDRDGPAARIVLNRPEKRNALSLAVMRE